MKTNHLFYSGYLCLAITFMFFTQANAQELNIPTPKNLSASLQKTGNAYLINLSWSEKQAGDTLTEGYYIFNNMPPGEHLYLNGRINRLVDHKYAFEVKYPYAADYHFAVRAASRSPYDLKSDLSDTLTVSVPSIKLPLVRIKEAVLNGSKLNVSWKYDQIKDLKAFEIVVNGSPTTVAPTQRKVTMDADQYDGEALVIQMKAETINDVSSDLSGKVFISRR